MFGQLHQNIKEKKKEERENLWLETAMQIISFFISIIFKHHPAAENKACEIRATFRGSLLAGGTLRRLFDIKHVIYLISLHGRNTTSGRTSKRNTSSPGIHLHLGKDVLFCLLRLHIGHTKRCNAFLSILYPAPPVSYFWICPRQLSSCEDGAGDQLHAFQFVTVHV